MYGLLADIDARHVQKGALATRTQIRVVRARLLCFVGGPPVKIVLAQLGKNGRSTRLS
jgi:hypothetical protein